jgi:serine protease Do
LGLLLNPLTAEQKQQLEVDHGLMVEDVHGGAVRSDLRPGDVLLALVNKGAQTELKTTEQFDSLLAKVGKGTAVTLLVRRGDVQTFITIKDVGDK